MYLIVQLANHRDQRLHCACMCFGHTVLLGNFGSNICNVYQIFYHFIIILLYDSWQVSNTVGITVYVRSCLWILKREYEICVKMYLGLRLDTHTTYGKLHTWCKKSVKLNCQINILCVIAYLPVLELSKYSITYIPHNARLHGS